MKTADIRLDLVQKIEKMSGQQLKDIYGLLQNYFNSEDSIEEWDLLTAQQKEKIEIGIRQADAGQTKPINEVTGRLRRKYGLND